MDRVEGSYLCPATVISRRNAQRCIYTRVIGQYRQASAVLPLENSRRRKRNRRFAYGRRELQSPCYAASHQQDGRRVDFRPKLAAQVSHYRNAIPLYVCTTIRKSTASYSYDEIFTSLLRDDRMKNRCDRALLYTPDRRGSGGVPGSSGANRVHLYLAFYRLFLEDDFSH